MFTLGKTEQRKRRENQLFIFHRIFTFMEVFRLKAAQILAVAVQQ